MPLADMLVQSVLAAGTEVAADAASAISRRLERELADREPRTRPFTFPPSTSRQYWLTLYRWCLEPICSPDLRERVAEEVFEQLSSPFGYELYPDALPTLHRLQASNFSLGVISNWEAWLPQLLDQFGLSRLMACAVASGTARVEKPDWRIFEAALRAADLEAGEVAYVGDSVTDDIEPSARAGLHPVLLDRAGRAIDFTLAPVIRSLDELPELLTLL